MADGDVEQPDLNIDDDENAKSDDHDYVNVTKECKPQTDTEYMNVGAMPARLEPVGKSVDTPITIDKTIKEKERETLFFKLDGAGGPRRIDYVLVYLDEEKDKKFEKRSEKRNHFQGNLAEEGIELEIEDKTNSVDGKSVYVKLHATWDALATGAELMNMKKRIRMPKELEDKLASCQCCDPFVVGEPIIQEEDDFFTAPFSVDRLHMFEVDPSNVESTNKFFSNAERSLIVKEILDRTSFTGPESEETRFGITRLLRDGAYTAAFPLHEGPYKANKEDPDKFNGIDKDRQRLWEAWARPGRWCFYQPLDLIRRYFGEKIAIYFTWLGFYTSMLIPAALLGIGVFIYGIVTMGENYPSEDICDSNKIGNITMCPQCDERCPYWKLKDSCIYARLTYVFDNFATVVFAVFMSVWATCFLEFWKRKQKEIEYEWDVAGFELEERMRPEYEFKVKKKKVPTATLR